ncbi:MAG: hypothetical protein AB7O60_18295 [Variibacter sp.]
MATIDNKFSKQNDPVKSVETETTSTLLPMLIGGLVLIVIGMLGVVFFT